MLALINNVMVECKVIDNMGYQGGKKVKEVLYKCKTHIVTNDGGGWKAHEPTVMPRGKITGASL